MNKNFSKQYTNFVTEITDGLTHAMALRVLKTKKEAGLIPEAVVVGYSDGMTGTFDKYWRYETDQESAYQAAIQAAINNGASIENFIESSAAVEPAPKYIEHVFVDGKFFGSIKTTNLAETKKRFYESAVQMQKDKDADHVIYCVIEYNNDNEVVEARFYSGLPMDDATFYQQTEAIAHQNQFIGAVHKKA